jgi:hypothetical protein
MSFLVVRVPDLPVQTAFASDTNEGRVAERCAQQVIHNLVNSAWYDQHPTAFRALKEYLPDIINDIAKVLKEMEAV